MDWSEQLSPTHSSVDDWPWSRKVDGFDPDNQFGTPQFNDLIYMRLAETYLLKAEAQVKGFDEQFEIVKAKFPKSTVEKRANNLGSYTVRKGGGSFMYTPGKPVI